MIVLPDPSATLYELVQGQNQTINVSVPAWDGSFTDFSSGYTADFTLYEKLGGGQIDYLTSVDSDYSPGGGAQIDLVAPRTDSTNILYRTNVRLRWDTADSDLILSTSRRRNNVLLYGDLRVYQTSFSATEALFTKQLKFSFRQTLKGS